MTVQTVREVEQKKEPKLCTGKCAACALTDEELISFYARDDFQVIFVLLIGAFALEDDEYEAAFLEILEADMQDVDELLLQLLR